MQKVVLEHLRTLTISLRDVSPDALGPLFNALSTPRLRELFLAAQADDDVQAELVTDIIFPGKEPRFKELEKLEFSISYRNDHKDASALEALF